MMVKDISAVDLQKWLQKNIEEHPFILDVRNDDELIITKLECAYHIPMEDIFDRLAEIPQNKPIVCMCHHGMRSLRVAHLLMQKGFNDIYNLEGGIHALSLVNETIIKY